MKSQPPFLTIVTRAFRRPKALAYNVSTIDWQTDQDLEHLIIVDHKGVGIYAADKSLHAHRHHVHGRFVYILDDDDYLVEPTFVEGLKKVVALHNPQIIMVKVKFPNGILPDPWEDTPRLCYVGSPNFVVEGGIWKAYIKAFSRNGSEGRAGDYRFIETLFKKHYRVYWWDRIIAEVPRVGRGQAEV